MIPLWVNIPNLPLQSWDKDVIRSIANAIGKVIAIDSATSNRTRLIQARFCVLVRVDKAVPTKVELEMEGERWTQDLLYETTSVRCFKCRRGGHLPQNCNQEAQEERRSIKEDNNNRKDNKKTEDNEQVKGKEEGPGKESLGEEDAQKDPAAEERQAKAGEEIESSNKEEGEASQSEKTDQERRKGTENSNKAEGETQVSSIEQKEQAVSSIETEESEEEKMGQGKQDQGQTQEKQEHQSPRQENKKQQKDEAKQKEQEGKEEGEAQERGMWQGEEEGEEYDAEEQKKWLRKQGNKARKMDKRQREAEEFYRTMQLRSRRPATQGKRDPLMGRIRNKEECSMEKQKGAEMATQDVKYP